MSLAAHDESFEYSVLYKFQFRCLNAADTDFDARVYPQDFDTFVKHAAVLPRMFGFAPSSQEMFKTAEARSDARKGMFKEMDIRKD